MDSFRVYARCRPLNQSQITYGASRKSIRILDNSTLSLSDGSTKQHIFQLNGVYDQHATNIDIFNEAIIPLIQNVLNGINSTALAYGITGAGKSFTMFGKTNRSYSQYSDSGSSVCTQLSGIIPLTFHHLLSITQNTPSIRLKISYIQIYNEQVFDLLQSHQQNLQLSQDPIQGCVIVQDLTQLQLNTYQEIQQLIRVGNSRRVIAQTKANEVSSRSHAIVIINIETQIQNSNQYYTAKLSLVDLAGSEKQSVHAETRGIRTFEGSNINRSLLTLGNCINMLSKNNGNNNGQQQFIPYRDSKLTRLLKDSLGGNTKTVMIACVSPSYLCYEETANTLKYACRANKIQKVVHQNIKEVKSVQEYKKEIVNLKKQNQVLKMNLNMSLMMPGLSVGFVEQEIKVKKGKVSKLLEDLTKIIEDRVLEMGRQYEQDKLSTIQKLSKMEQQIKSSILAEFDQNTNNKVSKNTLNKDKTTKKQSQQAPQNPKKPSVPGKKNPSIPKDKHKKQQQINTSSISSIADRLQSKKVSLIRRLSAMQLFKQTKQNKSKSNYSQYKLSLKQQLKLCEQQQLQHEQIYNNGNQSYRNGKVGDNKGRSMSINNGINNGNGNGYPLVNLQNLRKKIMEDKKQLSNFREQIHKGLLTADEIQSKALKLLQLQEQSILRFSVEQKQYLNRLSKGQHTHSDTMIQDSRYLLSNRKKQYKLGDSINGSGSGSGSGSGGNGGNGGGNKCVLNLLQNNNMNINRNTNNRHMESLNRIISMAKNKNKNKNIIGVGVGVGSIHNIHNIYNIHNIHNDRQYDGQYYSNGNSNVSSNSNSNMNDNSIIENYTDGEQQQYGQSYQQYPSNTYPYPYPQTQTQAQTQTQTQAQAQHYYSQRYTHNNHAHTHTPTIEYEQYQQQYRTNNQQSSQHKQYRQYRQYNQYDDIEEQGRNNYNSEQPTYHNHNYNYSSNNMQYDHGYDDQEIF